MHTHIHSHEQSASIAGVVSLVVLAVGLTVTAADLPMAIGYAARREASDEPDEPTADPVERLRQRYVEGEIDELAFERKLDAVIEEEHS